MQYASLHCTQNITQNTYQPTLLFLSTAFQHQFTILADSIIYTCAISGIMALECIANFKSYNFTTGMNDACIFVVCMLFGTFFSVIINITTTTETFVGGAVTAN